MKLMALVFPTRYVSISHARHYVHPHAYG